MPKTSQLDISKLKLDLKNFRTTPQKDEPSAIRAMISIKPDRFFAIMESILEDGYLLTENIILLQDNTNYIVREGNRRIAAMKLIYGIYNVDDFMIPNSTRLKIKNLSVDWKKENKKVPCTIYEVIESGKVEKIVALSHAKGEKASRDPWSSVARARYDRDAKGIAVPALELLEKYLVHGKNLTGMQKDRWGGEFPLTVLDEAIRKIYIRLGFKTTAELSSNYPKIDALIAIEDVIRDIGVEQLETREIRDTEGGKDFAARYNIPALVPSIANNGHNSAVGVSNSPSIPLGIPILNNTNGKGTNTLPSNGSTATVPTAVVPSKPVSSTVPPVAPANKAYATNDPKHVASLLKKFSPRGNNREKIVTLRDELLRLKIKENPIAFCLLLRSIFEISAKVYSNENGLSLVHVKSGKDKTLVELLNAITNRLTNNNTNHSMVKILHGATTEMSQPGRILSVTSMNQLVHNVTYSVSPPDICTLFGNIYPLLEAMN